MTMKKIYLLSLIFSLLLSFACSSDDDAIQSENPNENEDPILEETEDIWLIYLVGESDGIDIYYTQRRVCYEDGCVNNSNSSFIGAGSNSRRLFVTSLLDRKAIGVRIADIEINGGTGFIEIVEAKLVEDGNETLEEGETIFTSPRLEAGETYTLEFGDFSIQ